MALPRIVINRARVNVTFSDAPAYNVDINSLGAGGVTINYESEFADRLDSGSSSVISPKPYVVTTIKINIKKGTGVASMWWGQPSLDSYNFGNMSIFSDAPGTPAIVVQNVSFSQMEYKDFNGSSADFTVTLKGDTETNPSIFNGLV